MGDLAKDSSDEESGSEEIEEGEVDWEGELTLKKAQLLGLLDCRDDGLQAGDEKARRSAETLQPSESGSPNPSL